MVEPLVLGGVGLTRTADRHSRREPDGLEQRVGHIGAAEQERVVPQHRDGGLCGGVVPQHAVEPPEAAAGPDDVAFDHAALCDETGDGRVVRADIGRHNALDKLFGHCLRRGLSTKRRIIAFSGRLSSEVVLKAAKIGCPILLSKSAPTDLALRLADDLGITCVGFIRADSLNVYTHPQRIVMPM